MRNGLRGFKQGFSCPALLRNRLRVQIVFVYAAVTLYGPTFQRGSTNDWIGNSTVAGPTTPVTPEGKTGLGYVRFRSPLLSESRLLSFPPGTEMVHFPGFAHTCLCIQQAVLRFYLSGFPHSEIPGYNACLRLPGAYRSLPRPSSPSSAKASTMRP